MSDRKILELVIVLSVLVFGVTGLTVWLRSVFREMREEVKKRFRRKKILRRHNFAGFFGLESLGHSQVRGNGILVLGEDELYFAKALPRRETVIPLASITDVSNPRSHLGKSNVVKLLRVEFKIQSKQDAAAFAVDDVEAWTAAVEDARERARCGAN